MNQGAGLFGRSDFIKGCHRFAAVFKTLPVNISVPLNRDCQPLGQGVYNGCTDAVQPPLVL